KLVNNKFAIREHEPVSESYLNFTGYQPSGRIDKWYPHVTWQSKQGTTAGLQCPVWIASGLDVDLCFDAEILDVKAGVTYPADPIVIHPVNSGHGWIIPRDVRAFAKDRDGFVTVKVILKPSRALALTDPKVTSYYPDKIASSELRMKVWQKVPPFPTY